MTRVKKGLAAEHIAKARFLLEGFNVYEEVNYDSKIDFLIEKDGQFIRCQVKCVDNIGMIPFRHKTYSRTKSVSDYYTCKDVDYFIGVDLRKFDIYIIPISSIEGLHSKTVNKLTEYKNNFDGLFSCV